jgi:CrcB protein
MIRTAILVALAGALGTLARWGFVSAAARLSLTAFPWGTLAVNALGCFAFGAVAAVADSREAISHDSRLVLTTGFLGAFTTWSTFAFETDQIFRSGNAGTSAVYVALHLVLGLGLVALGWTLFRKP